MNSQIEALHTVVSDESLQINQRRDAAALVVTLTVDGVPDAADTDAEVIELTKPWADPVLAQIASEATGGRSLNGWSLPAAKAHVAARHRLRAVLAMVVDNELPRLIRLAAVSSIRAGLPAKHRFVTGAVSEDAMLDRVVGPGTLRLYPSSAGPGGYDRRPVARPPRDIGDVWQA